LRLYFDKLLFIEVKVTGSWFKCGSWGHEPWRLGEDPERTGKVSATLIGFPVVSLRPHFQDLIKAFFET
jgi:hypothetical protein